MSTLRISGLQKAFDGQLVLHDIDLAVRSGSLVALLSVLGVERQPDSA